MTTIRNKNSDLNPEKLIATLIEGEESGDAGELNMEKIKNEAKQLIELTSKY